MSARKTQTTKTDKSAGKKKPSSPDALIKSDKAELSEDELKDVSGGPIYMNTNLKI